MGNINWTRVILGGLLAGLIVDIFEFLVNAVLLANAWGDNMVSLGKPREIATFGIVLFNIWGLAIGIMAVWLYSAIRPRFGPGIKTAMIAAVAIWVVGYALANVLPVALAIAPKRLIALVTVLGFVEIVIATIAGAYLYKEDAVPVAYSRAAAG